MDRKSLSKRNLLKICSDVFVFVFARQATHDLEILHKAQVVSNAHGVLFQCCVRHLLGKKPTNCLQLLG